MLTRQLIAAAFKAYAVTSLSLSNCVSFPSFSPPLQVKMTAHARLKDKVTFHADERRPTCPLFSLNIHRRIDGVHPARLRVVLKNFHIEMDSERETGRKIPSGGRLERERQTERPQRRGGDLPLSTGFSDRLWLYVREYKHTNWMFLSSHSSRRDKCLYTKRPKTKRVMHNGSRFGTQTAVAQ